MANLENNGWALSKKENIITTNEGQNEGTKKADVKACHQSAHCRFVLI